MSNRSNWNARDYGQPLRGKIKGALIWVDIMQDKESRDEVAWAHRRNGRHVVTVGERVVRFDSVSITTYTITLREKVDPK